MAEKDVTGNEPFPPEFWQRFDSRTRREGECVVWTLVNGERCKRYGLTWRPGEWQRPLLVHRLAWIRANGPIPPGMVVCHRCDNPPCVNPAHLFTGTKGDNNRDCSAKGRHYRPTGELHPAARLDAGKVQRIRFLSSQAVPQRMIAAAYGVTRAAISGVVTRRLWRHVD